MEEDYEEQASSLKDLILPWMKVQRRRDECEKHGPYEAFRAGNNWSGCDKCWDIQQEEIRNAESKKSKRELWEKNVLGAGIPQRFTAKTLDTFEAVTEDQAYAKAWAVDYAHSFPEVMKEGRSAVFLGGPGTGKTHLACGIGLRVMGKWQSTVMFSTVQRLMRRVKESWTRGALETESQAIAVFTKPDLLILDEIGVQFGSDFEKQMLFDILNERYENCRPCILLSNLTLDGVREYLGERIADRLRENRGMVIVFNWRSYR